MGTVLIVGLLALIVLNLYASIQCFRDSFPSTSQRLAQIVFIWVLPALGAILVIRLLRIEPEQSQGKYPVEPSMGEEYVTGLGRNNSQGYISSPDDIFHSLGDSGRSSD